MIVDIAANGAARLEQADDLRRLHLRLAATDAARSTLATLSTADGPDHVRLATERLRGLAGARDAEWHRSFDAMIAYAAAKGWVDAEGAIRLHVESAAPD